MNKTVTLILLGTILSGLTVSAQARGWRGHSQSHFGVYLGGPMWWPPGPYYGYRPYYHGPQTIIIEREPPVYIQRQPAYNTPAPAAAPSAEVWYYCTDPAGYFPHIQNCAQPWIRVDPRTVQAQPNP